MIHHTSFCFSPFQENTYLIWNDSGEAIVADPGCYGREEENELKAFIENNNLNLLTVWLTHCHIDHVCGLDFVTRTWKIPFLLSQGEVAQLRAVEWYAPSYGFNGFRMPEGEPLVWDGGELSLGPEKFRVLQVPGHSPDHLAFYHSESGSLWAGDVLFRESVGRTDLPGGDFATLSHSVTSKIYTLPDDTVVYPGHGPETTIGHEKRFNPFIRT